MDGLLAILRHFYNSISVIPGMGRADNEMIFFFCDNFLFTLKLINKLTSLYCAVFVIIDHIKQYLNQFFMKLVVV